MALESIYCSCSLHLIRQTFHKRAARYLKDCRPNFVILALEIASFSSPLNFYVAEIVHLNILGQNRTRTNLSWNLISLNDTYSGICSNSLLDLQDCYPLLQYQKSGTTKGLLTHTGVCWFTVFELLNNVQQLVDLFVYKRNLLVKIKFLVHINA